jgi:hypothetical protein
VGVDVKVLRVIDEETGAWGWEDPGLLLYADEYVKVAPIRAVKMTQRFSVVTPEGTMDGEPGDYLAGPGAEGEFWPIKASIFEATYQKVERT